MNPTPPSMWLTSEANSFSTRFTEFAQRRSVLEATSRRSRPPGNSVREPRLSRERTNDLRPTPQSSALGCAAQHQYHLGRWQKCRFSDPAPNSDLVSQNL